MLDILTPLIKLERVSRKVDPATFTAVPGVWVKVQADGSLVNVTEDTPSTMNKMVISSASSNIYESHDVEVGRITTLESHGYRATIDSDGYTGSPSQGDLLAVSDKSGAIGKLFSITETPNSEWGTYEVVARCEEVDAVNGTITIRTISPYTVAMTAQESASESPSESPSASPS